MTETIVREKIAGIHERLAQSRCPEHGLAGGTLGLSYYYFHAGKALGEDKLSQKGMTLLETLFDELNAGGKGIKGSFLCDGAAGLGYVLNYLQNNDYIDFDVDNELVDLDLFLFESALDLLESDNMDCLYGAMGIFYYFARREQTPASNRYLNELSVRVLEKPVYTDHSIC